MFFAKGLGVTLAITALALILGFIIGFIVAIIRCTYESVGKLKISNAICKLYVTIMRGTPVVVQLLIIYFGGEVFRCTPLAPIHLLYCALIAFTVIPADMIRKMLFKKRNG